MNELIKISSNSNDEQVVSARELHKGLGLKKRFSVWWEQNSKLLIEHEDFMGVPGGTPITNGNGRTQILDDYALTIDTAKHLAMQSQTEKGREYRAYFIQVEKAWNSPDMVMKRALQIADKRVIALQNENEHLNLELAEANERTRYLDLIFESTDDVLVTQIAQDYGIGSPTFNKLLANLRIQRKVNNQWILYSKYQAKGYIKSRTHSFVDSKGNTHTNITTTWTQRGREFLYRKLKKAGYLPEIEKLSVF